MKTEETIMIIGICGNSGSGKTTLANQIIKLTDNKAIHLEIDKIGHKVLLLPEVKKELIKLYGNKILSESDIDRKKLSTIVFGSKIEMEKLTDITWKYMQIEIDNFLENNKNKIVILDWMLLSKSKYFDMCDIKILLNTPYDIRKRRATRRDNISEESFNLRDQASITYNEENFDYVLKTNEIGKKKLVKSLYKSRKQRKNK